MPSLREHPITDLPPFSLPTDEDECIKTSTLEGRFLFFYQSLWLYSLQWRFSHPRLPFPGASVEGEGREGFLFLPSGVCKHLLITARKSPEVCASLSCLVQLHSVQPGNREICCCAQRYRSKSLTPPQIYIPVQASLLNV